MTTPTSGVLIVSVYVAESGILPASRPRSGVAGHASLRLSIQLDRDAATAHSRVWRMRYHRGLDDLKTGINPLEPETTANLKFNHQVFPEYCDMVRE